MAAGDAAEDQVWHTRDEVADVFTGPSDPTWPHDRGLIDQTPHNPWDRDA